MAKDKRPEELPPNDLIGLDLRTFMVRMGHEDPRHLLPIVDAFEAMARGEKLRVVIAAPRQHGKSTLTMDAIPWTLLNAPRTPIAYCTYGQQFSGKHSRQMRQIAMRAGVRISADHNTIQEWRTDEGGGLLATSIDGPLTGNPVKIGIIDDPFKGRAEAESLEARDLAFDWLRGDLMGCLTPSGSIAIVASRYHEDDLSGRCIRKLGWDEIRLPAICDEEGDLMGRKIGEPLCPWGPDPNEPRTLEFLEAKREEVGPYDWESLYQGRPRARGGKVFSDLRTYEVAPWA